MKTEWKMEKPLWVVQFTSPGGTDDFQIFARYEMAREWAQELAANGMKPVMRERLLVQREPNQPTKAERRKAEVEAEAKALFEARANNRAAVIEYCKMVQR